MIGLVMQRPIRKLTIEPRLFILRCYAATNTRSGSIHVVILHMHLSSFTEGICLGCAVNPGVEIWAISSLAEPESVFEGSLRDPGSYSYST